MSERTPHGIGPDPGSRTPDQYRARASASKAEPRKWYAVWTKSHCEQIVHDQLAAKGFELFLPEIDVWSSRAGTRRLISTPMFPGYLFVHHEMDKTGVPRGDQDARARQGPRRAVGSAPHGAGLGDRGAPARPGGARSGPAPFVLAGRASACASRAVRWPTSKASSCKAIRTRGCSSCPSRCSSGASRWRWTALTSSRCEGGAHPWHKRRES